MNHKQEYFFKAFLSLPNKEQEDIPLSLWADSQQEAYREARKMVIKEELLNSDEEEYLKLELLNTY